MFRKSVTFSHQFWRHQVIRRSTTANFVWFHYPSTTTSCYPQREQQRHFSDKLLGHSPMAPARSISGVPQEESRIPTARDVEIAGGIWNPTSAKRDRLAELKVELAEEQYTLDDAATDQQRRDLYLADGVQWIVHTADTCRLEQPDAMEKGKQEEEETDDDVTTLRRELDPNQWDIEPSLAEVTTWMTEQEMTIQSTIPNGLLNKEQWDTYLEEAMQKIDEQLATLPAGRYLRNVRDFYTVPDTIKESLNELQNEIGPSEEQQQLTAIATKCIARYRLQLTKATCEHLKESWDQLTTLTDEALDRLAVKTDGHAEEESSDETDGKITALSLTKANKVIRTCLVGNASDRFDSWWEMVDHNGDGLLEKTAMEQVANSTVTPVQWALVTLYQEALEASAIRGKADDADEKPDPAAKKPGWLEQRRENKAKKHLLTAFQRATKKHFDDEVEMPHRLRCIYAWAEKQHQDNKVDSVLIEASGWSGRKRYVELPPKISLPEFREVQEIHLTHLDRIGWEITKSFREDLLVEQGKGRQSAELRRDCMLFLLVVSLIDYGILIL